MYTLETPWVAEAKLVGKACSVAELADLLEEAAGGPGTLFEYFAPISGASRSGRIFCQDTLNSLQEVVSMRNLFSCYILADELLQQNFVEHHVRYNPAEPPDLESCRGWEVRTVNIGASDIVIVWAAWVTCHNPPHH